LSKNLVCDGIDITSEIIKEVERVW